MTKEVFELLKKMDIRSVEAEMLFRCAPFIAGLKTSNLLIVRSGQQEEIRRLLQGTKADSFLLYQGGQKTALLLYDTCLLEEYLERKAVRRVLSQQGYADISFSELLRAFALRYEAYMHGSGEFPHEMGLFLGYPAEDVEGFIENKGQNALYTGYWKVYKNALQKIRLFQKFDRARETLIRLAADGNPVSDLINSSIFIPKSIDGYVSAIVQ